MIRTKLKALSPQTLLAKPMVRWWIVGCFFMVMNLPLLYVFKERFLLPLWQATLVASEFNTILRFFVNDRWVFGHPRPTWKRCGQYHVAIASSFVIWYTATNLLAYWGINYLVASVLGTCCSVGWSIFTNFFWIWRQPKPTDSSPRSQ